MDKPHILIVEDDPKIAELLKDYLEKTAGFECTLLDRGDLVLDYVLVNPPTLALLDVMLPGLDGLSVARQLRDQTKIPFVMVTARVEEVDRLIGLELGAEDYICKPFSPREVVARIRNILRRVQPNSTSGPSAAALQINSSTFEANVHGVPVKLTPVEFALLKHMASKPGQIFSRQQLMDAIYPDHRVVSDRTVDTHVKNIRRKLGDLAPGQSFIESVYGVGFRFISH